MIKPLVAKGAIIGVFLGDERMYFGLKLNEVKMIADEVRKSFPEAIIFLNEAPDITMCNMRSKKSHASSLAISALCTSCQLLCRLIHLYACFSYAEDNTTVFEEDECVP